MNESALENLIAKFERDFSAGKFPDIDHFISQTNDDSERLFNELVHTELELRIRAGENARVEEYAKRFERIENGSNQFKELVDTEFKIRRLFEPGLSVEEYQHRFPDYFPELIHKFASDISTSAGNGETIIGNPVEYPTFSDANSRFRKIRLHQQGGLGNIWKAVDTELDRVVAVKEIKPKYARLHTHRARFAREIIVSTKLEHPGILPIYGLGYLTDGTPYFAMQFISGITLKSAIVDLSMKRPVRKLAESIEFRRLLQHFLDVCNTIEYAHSQNVIHRDLKPSNIMIGKFGETYVVDWGLASLPDHKIQTSHQNNAGDTSFEFMARESLMGDSTDGTMIGSPGFMSPEQKAGALSRIGVRSDVFSLGATLLSLISLGRLPDTQINEGSPTGDNFDLISSDLLPLASICRTAMADNVSDRYSSAKELAEDVERFLLDESVSAHVESTTETLSRFSRRHRAILNTTMMALAVLSLVTSAAALWINSERTRAVAAKVAEGVQRKKVELALSSESKRKHQLTKNLGIFTDLFSGPDASELCLDLEQVTLQQALNQLDERINEYSDPMAQSFLLTVLGRNKKVKGNYQGAEADFVKSRQLLIQENISSEDPLLVDVMIELCAVKSAMGNLDDAEELALRIIELCKNHPETLETANYEILLLYVPILMRHNRLDEAEALSQRALELGNRIYADNKSANNFLWGQFVYANVRIAKGHRDQADQIFREIVAAQQANGLVHPLGISSRVRLSESLYIANKKDDAKRVITGALKDVQEVLGSSHPDTLKIQSWAGTILATNKNESDRKKGIELLEQTWKFQMQNMATTSQATIGTASLIANVLLQQDSPASTQKAIDVCLKTIDKLNSINLNAVPKILLPLSNVLSIAYEKQGDFASALHWNQDSIRMSIELEGVDSAKTIKLKKRRDELVASKASSKRG